MHIHHIGFPHKTPTVFSTCLNHLIHQTICYLVFILCACCSLFSYRCTLTASKLSWWRHRHVISWTSSSVFQLKPVYAPRGAHCHRGKKEGNVCTRYTPLSPCLTLNESFLLAFLLCYCISNKCVHRKPNLDRKISLCIPKAVAALRKIHQLKFTWVFTL